MDGWMIDKSFSVYILFVSSSSYLHQIKRRGKGSHSVGSPQFHDGGFLYLGSLRGKNVKDASNRNYYHPGISHLDDERHLREVAFVFYG